MKRAIVYTIFLATTCAISLTLLRAGLFDGIISEINGWILESFETTYGGARKVIVAGAIFIMWFVGTVLFIISITISGVARKYREQE